MDDEKEHLLLKRQELIEKTEIRTVRIVQDEPIENITPQQTTNPVNPKPTRTFKSSNPTKLLQKSDLEKLIKPDIFVSNYVIDCAINHMCTKATHANYLALPSCMYSNIEKGSCTSRQTKNYNIFDFDVVITTANFNKNHWIAISYNVQENIVQVYDPLHSNKAIQAVGENMVRWIQLEAETRNINLALTKNNPTYCLMQEDGTSCWLFCLEYIDALINNLQPDGYTINPCSTRRKYYDILKTFVYDIDLHYEDITSDDDFVDDDVPDNIFVEDVTDYSFESIVSESFENDHLIEINTSEELLQEFDVSMLPSFN